MPQTVRHMPYHQGDLDLLPSTHVKKKSWVLGLSTGEVDPCSLMASHLRLVAHLEALGPNEGPCLKRQSRWVLGKDSWGFWLPHMCTYVHKYAHAHTYHFKKRKK